MGFTNNTYLKRAAEKLTSPIKGRRTDNYYLKVISENISKGGGGGGSYDDTELRNRIIALENGKQNKLTAGQNITINANTIAAREIIDDTINSPTTVWSSKKVKDLIEALEGGAKVRIVATRPDPSVAEEKTMYYVGTTAPFHIWFFVNDSYTDVGTTDINLENYFTKDEINALLATKVDKETGKVLIPLEDLAQITTNKTDIATLQTDKQNKITDSTLSELSDSTTVSSVSASSKTNKTFALSDLWDYIKGKITATYYPVGSVVLNMGTNPSESFGGTWELLATGTKALYLDSTAGTAVSEELPDPQITLANAGQTRLGDNNTKLVFFQYTTSGSNKWGYKYDSGSERMMQKKELSAPVTTASNHTHTATIGNSTYSDDGKVRAEGITVCAWKRTA